MSAAARKSPSSSTEAPTVSESEDALVLLAADHRQVKALFTQYDRLARRKDSDDERQVLAEHICRMLTAHATAEEELFYPAAREALGDHDTLIDEATVEHTTAKDLVAQIQESSPDEPLYDAKVKVLAEYVDHHVQEEEGEIFPKARQAGLDTAALGRRIAARKAALMAELGG